MTIAASTVLIIIGAILRFAVTWTTKGIDIAVVGDILMAGGVVGLIIALTLIYTRRRRVGDPAGPAQVYEERRYTDDPRTNRPL
jgi:hypothetical protein